MATHTALDASPSLLSAQDLSCRRGDRLLFEHLDLSLSPGEAVWVRGPNGRGKTSLLRLLAGLSQPAAGHIKRHATVLYLGHQHALKDDLTATEALTFLLRLHDMHPSAAEVTEALGRLGVKGRRSALVRTLSQGQRRRVALARLALSPPASVWILDEPFDALDDQGIGTLNEMIESHRQSGGALVLTSHQDVHLPRLTTRQLGGQNGS